MAMTLQQSIRPITDLRRPNSKLKFHCQ